MGLGGLGERDWVEGREVTSDRQGKLPEPGRRTWGGCQPGQMAETLQGQRGGRIPCIRWTARPPFYRKQEGLGHSLAVPMGREWHPSQVTGGGVVQKGVGSMELPIIKHQGLYRVDLDRYRIH